MKSIVNNNKRNPKTFPYLGKSNREIVLFSSPSAGVVVSQLDPSGYPIGHHTLNWVSDSFVDFEGSVTLSND